MIPHTSEVRRRYAESRGSEAAEDEFDAWLANDRREFLIGYAELLDTNADNLEYDYYEGGVSDGIRATIHTYRDVASLLRGEE